MRCASFALLLAIATAPRAAHAAVQCVGTQNPVTTGVWSVTAAALQDRTEAPAGPNLVQVRRRARDGGS